MILFFVGLSAVLLIGMLSRDHDISASQEAVLGAELHLDDAMLAALPDRIHLSRCAASSFTFPDDVRGAREGLAAEGFASAGEFEIAELPGVCVTLMVHGRESLSAAVYDHARAGVWIEVVSRYQDGRRCIHTTLCGEGTDTRPGNQLVSMPGASLAELLRGARRDRPTAGILRKAGRREAVSEFEQDYAAWIAFRKQRSAVTRSSDSGDDQLPLAA